MILPESFIQDVLHRVDVVNVLSRHLTLKKAGANYVTTCPFHREKTPSFNVSPIKQVYHCFGCGVGGNAITFLMAHEGMNFLSAITELAQSVGLALPKDDTGNKPASRQKPIVGDVLKMALRFYKSSLKSASLAIEYLKNRGIDGVTAKKFELGYAPDDWQGLMSIFEDYQTNQYILSAGLVAENDKGKRYDRFRNRIMFPIYNPHHELIAFGGRVLDANDQPKYYNSPETDLFHKNEELYGLHLSQGAIRRQRCVVVVEGYMDVIALSQQGIEYVVATLGTAVGEAHIRKLLRYTDKIVFCFDGDNAGRNAAWRVVTNVLSVLRDNTGLMFLFLPDKHDPDSYIRQYGKLDFEQKIAQAIPLSQYIIQHLTATNSLQSQEDVIRFLYEVKPILEPIKSSFISFFLQKSIAELIKVSVKDLQRMLKLDAKHRPSRSSKPIPRQFPVSLAKRLSLILLYYPQHAALCQDDMADRVDSRDEVLLQHLIAITKEYPHEHSSAVILQLLLNRLGESFEQDLQEARQEVESMFNDDIDYQAEVSALWLKLQQPRRSLKLPSYT